MNRYEQLSEDMRKQIDAYDSAIEDMYQAMDDFDTSFGESIADQIRADVLDEAFIYLKEVMSNCRETLMEELVEETA